MSPRSKRWDEPDASVAAAFDGVHPLVSRILHRRGIATATAAQQFLHPDVLYYAPQLLSGMEVAVQRILAAIDRREKIVVYGDFDADGVTATVLLVQTLTAAGANVEPYIPDRVDEGYGLNMEALRKLSEVGAHLIITVDNGVRSVSEVEYARQIGLDVIVTDHHAPGETLPHACAVINPKQAGDRYPFKELAGVGIAFKVAQALLLVRKDMSLNEDDLLDLVALGTIADLAPLIDENRFLVMRGLKSLREAKRPGIRALIAVAGLQAADLTSDKVGWNLAPRINAAGRLRTAEESYRLLITSYEEEATQQARMLDGLNRERQELTHQTLEAARQLAVTQSDGQYIHIVQDTAFNPGIVGLVAGRLCEETYRPTVVMEVGEVETRGSARSIPEFHITHALDRCADLLIRHGGHSAAAGFTVLTRDIPALRDRLTQIARSELEGRELQASLFVDAYAALHELDIATLEKMDEMQPFGSGNPGPILAARDLEVAQCRRIGKTGEHLQLRVRAPDDEAERVAVAWGQAQWLDRMPDRIDLAFTLEINEYRGDRSLRLNVKDIRPAGGAGQQSAGGMR